jgi:hypothetical protein
MNKLQKRSDYEPTPKSAVQLYDAVYASFVDETQRLTHEDMIRNVCDRENVGSMHMLLRFYLSNLKVQFELKMHTCIWADLHHRLYSALVIASTACERADERLTAKYPLATLFYHYSSFTCNTRGLDSKTMTSRDLVYVLSCYESDMGETMRSLNTLRYVISAFSARYGTEWYFGTEYIIAAIVRFTSWWHGANQILRHAIGDTHYIRRPFVNSLGDLTLPCTKGYYFRMRARYSAMVCIGLPKYVTSHILGYCLDGYNPTNEC